MSDSGSYSDNVTPFPKKTISGRDGGNGGGNGDLSEKVTHLSEGVIRLEATVNHLRETAVTKEDLLASEIRTQKLITDAIKDLKQEHISFYRWMIGTLISLLAIAGLYLYPKMNR
uniref:Haemolysin XhlA n=1 Tax=Candidatus Kentrum eta TaxID=2126337 RepID=A0A450VCX8_9GAMM|nr:MAG: hypothetical protein BECKH772A_GA0070896_102813 [Candidatus Kentron sp. H]VFK05571.1 MAG: hypothetical protein BECKH772C_GA0070978_102833 [Candidatus Kentron sp. H]